MRTPAVPTPTDRARVAIDPPEVVEVHEHRVSCEGIGGALGHPRVYLEMGAAGFVECGYCDRRFVLAGHQHPESERFDPADYESGALKPSSA